VQREVLHIPRQAPVHPSKRHYRSPVDTEDRMNPEQAAIVLAISVEEVEDLAATIGADLDDGLSPEQLVAMAAILDAQEEGDEDGEDDQDGDDADE
jgi:hypothetical protein